MKKPVPLHFRFLTTQKESDMDAKNTREYDKGIVCPSKDGLSKSWENGLPKVIQVAHRSVALR